MAKKKFKIPMKGDTSVSDATPSAVIPLCAGCTLPAKKNWVILGDGRTIHLGGSYGLRCFNIVNGIQDEEEEE